MIELASKFGIVMKGLMAPSRKLLVLSILVASAAALLAPVFQAAAAQSEATPEAATSLEELRGELQQVSDQIEAKKETGWGSPATLGPLIGGVIVALIGGAATYLFNKRQTAAEAARAEHEQRIARVQTLQAFLPELSSSDQRKKEAAVLAITSLGDAELMSRIVKLFEGQGVTNALTKVASRGEGASVAIAEEALQQVMDSLRPAVVVVGETEAFCSGFVASAGVVVTVAYGVPGAAAVPLRFSDDRKETASVLIKDEQSRLAALAADTENITPLPLETDPGALEPPFDVIVLGYTGARTGHVSVGKVTGWTDEYGEGPLLTAELDTESGFSGAPVVNSRGNVVGIAHASDEELGYLIPSTSVADLLNAVIAEQTSDPADPGSGPEHGAEQG